MRYPFPPPSLRANRDSADRTSDSHIIANLDVGVGTPIRTLDSANVPMATGIDPLIKPSPKNWFEHRYKIKRLCRIHYWPLGRAKYLLRSSFLQAAAEVANCVDFALEDGEVSLDVVLNSLQAKFLSGANTLPALNEFLDARQTATETLPE